MEKKANIGCECIHWHFSSRVFGPTLRLTWTRHLMWERFSQRSLRLWKSTGIWGGWNQPGILKWDPCLGGIQHLQMYGNFEGFRFQSALLGVVIFHDLCQPTVQMTWAMKNYHWLIWWYQEAKLCSATLFHPEYANLIWESKKMASFTFGLKIDLVCYFFVGKFTAIFLASIPFLETKSARSVISRKAPQMQFMRKNVEKHAKDYQMFVCKICMYFVYRHLCPTCSFHRIYIHPCNVEDVFIYTNDMIFLDLFLCFEKFWVLNNW